MWVIGAYLKLFITFCNGESWLGRQKKLTNTLSWHYGFCPAQNDFKLLA